MAFLVSAGAVSFDGRVPEAYPPNSFFLGRHRGVPWFAVPAGAHPVLSLRKALPGLDRLQRAAALTAVALDNWHAASGHCARCGGATTVDRGGWARICPSDDSEHFPRVDPAVIMLVTDEQDRALLGRRSVWPPGWMSTLAGFVEPGESFEQAVARETLEEAGVAVLPRDVHYLASQPWPFPQSIMVGCLARGQSTEPIVDGREIAEARWFSRQEFSEACADGKLRIPPDVSIAHRLIRHWFGREITAVW